MSNGSPRKIGRPRATGDTPGGSVAEDILAAARRLFRQKGFAGTSTREIANAVGLRQPSLFHYFPNKEAIFRSVVLGTVEPILEFIVEERGRVQPPEIALYRLVWFDTHHLCVHESAIGSPFTFSEISHERMPELWEKRDQIINEYRRHLRRGTRSGVFVVEDLKVTTNLVFSLGESTLGWYEKHGPAPASKTADLVAGLALRAVLDDPDRLTEVRDASATAELPTRR